MGISEFFYFLPKALAAYFNPATPVQIQPQLFVWLMLLALFLMVYGFIRAVGREDSIFASKGLAVGLAIAIALSGALALGNDRFKLAYAVTSGVFMARILEGASLGAGLRLIAPYGASLFLGISIPVAFSVLYATEVFTESYLTLLSVIGYCLSLLGIYSMTLKTAPRWGRAGRLSVATGYFVWMTAGLMCVPDPKVVHFLGILRFASPAAALLVVIRGIPEGDS